VAWRSGDSLPSAAAVAALVTGNGGGGRLNGG
jgi:hypothetical protein